MFLAYSAASNDQPIKTTVLSVLKERLKNGFIRTEIIEKTFQLFTPVSKLFHIVTKIKHLYRIYYRNLTNTITLVLCNILKLLLYSGAKIMVHSVFFYK